MTSRAITPAATNSSPDPVKIVSIGPMWMPSTMGWKERSTVLTSKPARAMDSIWANCWAGLNTAIARPMYCDGISLSISGVTPALSTVRTTPHTPSRISPGRKSRRTRSAS
jgi:hypothetical protein